MKKGTHGESLVMKAKVGVTQLQSKECKNASNHRKLGKGKEIFHYGFWRERGSADTLILDFWPLDL